ncbi:hypothetical protein acsn021_11670 [Anaerocolumna cellulosilytica]|uniref:Uncharacterized protein n=1 Tax=Anaerocolumna cellulosilytica TaxID=433286 RepID=A0A6S6R3H5_9FIRM|nr:hypothetical protein [Anaerocolumna cellulosilytica]MBB5196098.1 hypothetical protein [Anaerocolumna cellulosilytica]BCJ93598.1 hypothetical protein acsn021_11670 [Anaerocolumna cellulosilytica]
MLCIISSLKLLLLFVWLTGNVIRVYIKIDLKRKNLLKSVNSGYSNINEPGIAFRIWYRWLKIVIIPFTVAMDIISLAVG